MENNPYNQQASQGEDQHPGLQEDLSVPVQQEITQSTESLIEWRASEYITKEKGHIWFILFGVAVLILLSIAIFLMKDILFSILIVVMGVAIVVFARRPAHEMTYQLNNEGLSVNGKFFPFNNFRAFGILREGGMYSVSLLPVKRFSPSVDVYFPPENGEAIVDILGARLPMEELKPDVIDKITDKLHF